jgi:thiol-disulfide isomerase/thioredoxin
MNLRLGYPFVLRVIALSVLLVALSTFGLHSQTVPVLDGKTIDLAKEAAGKPYALIFVRTDCPISNRYAPVLQELQKHYQDRVAFWLVYADRDETVSTIQDHLHQYGYNIPAIRDPQQKLVPVSQVSVTPEAAVFTASGVLIYHGRIDNWYESFGHARPAPTTHELHDALDAVVAGKRPAVATARSVGCYLADLR